MLRTIALTMLALVLAAVLALAAYVASRQHLRFDVPYPPIAASTDPAVIERGRYIVRNVSHCRAATAIRHSTRRSSVGSRSR